MGLISLGGTRDAHKCKDGGTPGVTSATAPPTVEQDKLLGRSLMETATRQTNTKRKCPTDVHLLIDSQQVQIFFFSGGSEKKGASRGRPYASTLGWCSLNKQPQEMYAILFKDTGKTEARISSTMMFQSTLFVCLYRCIQQVFRFIEKD